MCYVCVCVCVYVRVTLAHVVLYLAAEGKCLKTSARNIQNGSVDQSSQDGREYFLSILKRKVMAVHGGEQLTW